MTKLLSVAKLLFISETGFIRAICCLRYSSLPCFYNICPSSVFFVVGHSLLLNACVSSFSLYLKMFEVTLPVNNVFNLLLVQSNVGASLRRMMHVQPQTAHGCFHIQY